MANGNIDTASLFEFGLTETKPIMPIEAYMSETAREIGGVVTRFTATLDGVHGLCDDPELTSALKYALADHGKLVRPVLAHMTIEDLEAEPSGFAKLYKAIHLIHTSSLIKDDLPQQDNATLRRGKPTLHIEFSEHTAQLASDWLLAAGIEEVAKITPANNNELVRYFTRKIRDLCEGQHRDLSRKPGSTTAELEKTARLKTGSIFELSMVSAAIAVDATPETTKGFECFAEHLGIAFQIKDDVLGANGSSLLTGKDNGIDARNRKTTFIQTEGSVARAIKLMDRHANTAKELSEQLPGDTVRRNSLVNLVLYS